MTDRFKNMPASQIAVGIILISLLPLLFIWYKSRKNERNKSKVEQVSISTADGVYESKLAAYKAKQRQERERSSIVSVVNNPLETFSSETFGEDSDNKELQSLQSNINRKKITRSENITTVTDTKSEKRIETTSPSIKLRNSVKQETQVIDGTPSNATDQSLLERKRQERMAGWNKSGQSATGTKTYKGVIHGTQELAPGQTALLRLREEIRQGNIIIPVNTLISGKVSISQGRVMIDISSIKLKDGIYTLGMSIYGSDGLAGLPTSMDIKDNAINKEVTNEAISQIRKTGVAGSIASSVAGAVTRDKSRKVTLIDAQNIYFKVNSK